MTRVLTDAGEAVHPASSWLASETGHIDAEAGEHDLHAFQAIRRMDEILVANFGVFRDVVDETPYDLVIGDEAWDVDYFLHENPELKRFAFAWMTDFVGWLPMPDGGAHEAALTADYNAEMIEQRARFRRVRDRSVFVGDPDDIVPDDLGPGLPSVRDWTEDNFAFAGYVSGLDPITEDERAALRVPRSGYGDDERVCVVTVGGLGSRRGPAPAGARRSAGGAAGRRRPAFRRGGRARASTRGSLPQPDGADVRGYVPDLHHHLAVCDIAVTQGGLTTCMELTANRRPFVYVPLRHHFEQNTHVRHRLERYGAGRRLDYDVASDPDAAGGGDRRRDRPAGRVPAGGDRRRRPAPWPSSPIWSGARPASLRSAEARCARACASRSRRSAPGPLGPSSAFAGAQPKPRVSCLRAVSTPRAADTTSVRSGSSSGRWICST